MNPVCFRIGSFPVHWYGVMMALGFFAGLANWTWLGRKRGWNFNFCSDLLFWIMVSGIAGARVAYVISDLDSFREEPWTVFFVHQGGLIFYGGLIGGVLAVFVFARVRGVNSRALLDLVASSTPLGHAFGRIGCFLNGCCHGKVDSGPLAVTYPAESLAWWQQVHEGLLASTAARSLAVTPVQLYEAALNLLTYLLLVHLYRGTRRHGLVCGVYFVVYACCRFVLEFLRGDARVTWLGLSVAQILSFALVLAGAGLLLRGRSAGHAATS